MAYMTVVFIYYVFYIIISVIENNDPDSVIVKVTVNFIYAKEVILNFTVLLFKLNSDVFADFSKLDGISKMS